MRVTTRQEQARASSDDDRYDAGNSNKERGAGERILRDRRAICAIIDIILQKILDINKIFLPLHSDWETDRRNGLMAEWLGRGLQNLVQRFESASDLTKVPHSYLWGIFFYSCLQTC